MKRKLERFRIIEERANVVEPSKSLYQTIKGNWGSYFGNSNPITLELACGRGEYSNSLASRFPDRNYIGVDIKGERIWKGSTIAMEEGHRNVAFLRTHILVLENFFDKGEVDEIWLTFPDPRPRKRDIKRRLTSPRYLAIYQRIIREAGFVRLKTDNTILYEYTRDLLCNNDTVADFACTENLYQSSLRPECFDIRTKYEEQFASEGATIKYLRFRFIAPFAGSR